ncbi:MAG: hypothetical protein ABI640_12875 [Gammaproteobacteria bacterium]
MQSSSGSTGALPVVLDTVRIVSSKHALSNDIVEAYAPAGLTLREIIGNDSDDYAITIDGTPLPLAEWTILRTQPGQLITIAVRPRGDDVKTIVLTAALIAAAFFGGPAIAGLAAFSGSAVFSSAAFWMGTIYAVGSLALQSLIKPPTVEAEPTPRQLQSVTGIRNEFRPFGAVPVLYGKHKVFPSYAALPYTEIIGEDQYFNALFAIGLGEHVISDAKIGETLLTNYQGVELTQTTAPEWPLLLEQSLATALEDPAKPGTPVSTATFTTEDNIERISVDFVCPTGLIYVKDKGEREQAYIDFLVEFRASGSSDAWTNVRTLVGTDPGYLGYDPTWIQWTLGYNNVIQVPGLAHTSYVGPLSASPANSTDFRVSGRTRDAIRFGLRWEPPTSGHWDVRVTRTIFGQPGGVFDGTQKEFDKFLEVFIWTTLRSHDVDTAAVDATQGVDFLKIRIKASDVVNGILDQFSVIAERKLRSWDVDTQAFTAAAITRNPAWAYIDMLTGLGNARPVTDPTVRIWLDEIAEWADACTTADRKFDRVFDQETTVFEALGVCAAAGRAGRSLRDAKHVVIREEQATTPSQIFTPRNSWGFSFEHRFVEMPHGLKCRFLSELQGYQQDEVIVYDDGYNAGNATKFETVTFDGKVDPDEVWKFGRYHLAQARLRPALYTLNVDVEHLASVRGDMVHVEHDVVLWNQGRGRISRLWGRTITLDESFVILIGTSYILKIRSVDSAGAIKVIDYTVTAPAGPAIRTFTFSPTADLGSIMRVGDLAILGVAGQEDVALKIIRVQPRQGLRAELTLVDAAPEILTADSGTIPAYEPNITAPVLPQDVVPPAPIILLVASEPNGGVVLPSGHRAARLLISYFVPSFQGTIYDTVEARIRVKQTGLEQPWIVLPTQGIRSGSVATFDVEPGETYQIGLRVVTVYGRRSAWSATTEHEVSPMVIDAPGPDAITVETSPDGILITLNITSLEHRSVARTHVRLGAVNNRDHASTESYRFPVPSNFASMDELDLFVALAGAAAALYLWVRFEDIYENVGPWLPVSATGGVAVAYPGQAVSGYVSGASHGTQFIQASDGSWNESETDVVFEWVRAGDVVATRTVRVTRTDETLTAALQASTGEATTHTTSGDSTGSLFIVAAHTNSGVTVSQNVTAVQSGADGADGQSGKNALNRNPTFSAADGVTPSSDGWTLGAGQSAVALTDGISGLNALRTNAAAERDFYSEVMAIDPSGEYRVSCYARQASGTPTNFLFVDFIDASGASILGSGSGATGWAALGGYFYFARANQAFATSFTKYEITFGPGQTASIPTGAVACRIGALINYSGSAAENIDVQNYRLESKKDGADGNDGAPGIDAGSWVFTGTFSASDEDTVAWGAGTLKDTSGNSYSISGSNTGDMVAPTYIYWDPAVSTTAFQSTTTAGNSTGGGKILIATANPSSSGAGFDAGFHVFSGAPGTLLITGDQLAATVAIIRDLIMQTGGKIRFAKTSASDTTNGAYFGDDGAGGVDLHLGDADNYFWFDKDGGPGGVAKLLFRGALDFAAQTFTPTGWADFSSDPAGDLSYIDFGSFVMIFQVSDNFGTSNGTQFYFTGGLPASIQPATQRAVPVIGVNNGGYVAGHAIINGAGIGFNSGNSPVGWLGSGTKGLPAGMTIIYAKG